MPEIIAYTGPDSSSFIENYVSTMRKDYYNYRATVLFGMGDKAGAYRSYQMWAAMSDVKSSNDALMLDYLISSSHYDEAIRFCELQREYVEKYPYSLEARTVAEALADIYESRGDAKRALLYGRRLLEIIDTIRVREHKSRALEYATIYETQEKEAELVRRKADIESQRKKTHMWIVLASISIAALVVVVITDRRRRMAYKRLAEKNRMWAKSGNDNEGRSDVPTEEDLRIMKEVRAYVEDQHNYRNSTLSLNMLAADLSVNRKYLSTAINRTTNHNFNAYVNELRVKEAVRLLSDKNRSKMSIDEISEYAGFNNRGSFYEWFKKYTAFTPTQFRKSL
jgi:AraC-like DNA-binding protein